MVDQLKRLEKALEQGLQDGDRGLLESAVDEFLNEYEDISASDSSKLHDLLLRAWIVLKKKWPEIEKEESDYALSPASTTTTVEVQPLETSGKSVGSMVLFLDTLVRLGPCLVNESDLEEWWRQLAPLAIDSTGYLLDLVDRAQAFITGVLTSSFYVYADPSSADHFAEIAAFYGQKVLDIYVHQWFPSDSVHWDAKPSTNTDERRRFLLMNCRSMFGQFARKDNRTAFTQINTYFVNPENRVVILDLVVEYLSESQNSKLFRVYESPFFESLMVCLEHDTSRVVLQLAIATLSMLMVHICDKLVSTGMLFRIYGVFGRACSWQPQKLNFVEGVQPEKDGSASEITNDAPAVETGDWVPLVNKEEDEQVDDMDITVRVVSLFTFLYGLFPLNTLKFCRQCDEYFKQHGYKRNFSDFWSRFMVTRKAERLVRQFRVDPLFILGSEETELTNSVQRFQEVGSVLGLSSICTSRRIFQIDDEEEEATHNVTLTNDGLLHKSETQDHHEVQNGENITMYNGPDVTNKRKADRLAKFENHLVEHRKSFEMHGANSASHWHRELLLIRTELAFANFSRDMSEQRALRWQKRAASSMILISKSESLSKENDNLRNLVTTLKEEVTRAVRAARNILRERSAYETKILERNREYRDKVKTLEESILDFKVQTETAISERDIANGNALESRNDFVRIDDELRSLKSDMEAATRSSSVTGSKDEAQLLLTEQLETKQREIHALEENVHALKWTMERLEQDQNENIRQMQKEVEDAQASYAQVKDEEDRKLRERNGDRVADATAHAEEKEQYRRVKLQNEDLIRRCMALEHDLRARKVHEEERLNELQAAVLSSRPYAMRSSENRFRGRGGAQGVYYPK